MTLNIVDLSVSIGDRDILHNINLTVETGTTLGLLGANGSGKSTLLKTLYRVQAPTSGRVLLDGTDLASLGSIQAARAIAAMTQEITSDFPLTGREVALLGRVPHQRGFGADSPQDLEIVAQALADAGATHLAERSFATLSGGEKQRVLLARALTQQTPVLVLDEPTNHADLFFQHELMHTVAATDKTVVVALHDMNLALTYCDAIAVLDRGRLVAHGNPHQILDPALVEEVFGVSSRAVADPRGGHVLSLRRRDSATHTTHPNQGEL